MDLLNRLLILGSERLDVQLFYLAELLSRPKLTSKNFGPCFYNPQTSLFILLLLLMSGDAGVGIERLDVQFFYLAEFLLGLKLSHINFKPCSNKPWTSLLVLLLLLMSGDTGVGINPGPSVPNSPPNHVPTFHMANIQNLTGDEPFVKKMDKIGFLQEQCEEKTP